MSTKKSSKKVVGICRLTLTSGPYVKAHLIPEALTRLSRGGEKFYQGGHGHRFRKVPSSWYDLNLTTRKGEDVLERIDSAGIKELRKHRLIWSGWAPDEQSLQSHEVQSFEGAIYLREIHFDAPDVLRIFFLSLLWRAAASTRPEFSDIQLPDEDVEDLRLRVLGNISGRLEDYPIQFHQIITRGEHHNRTPVTESQPLGENDISVPYVRFYFEGLVTNVYLGRRTPLGDWFSQFCVGFTDRTLIIAHKYEESRAHRDLEEIKAIADSEPFRRPIAF